MHRAIAYAAFLVLVVGGGLLIGTLSRPDGWYAALNKPAFMPPGWLFAPVWTVLYVMIAVAGARTHERGARTGLKIWAAQLALNFAWTPVFFGLHQPLAALVIVAALLVTCGLFIKDRWLEDRVSAWLFMPYAAWVAFATRLNLEIVRMN